MPISNPNRFINVDELDISRVVAIKPVFKTDAQTSSNVAAATAVAISGLAVNHAVAKVGNTVLLICALGMATSSVNIGNVGLTLFADNDPLQIGDAAGGRVRVNSAYLLPDVAGFAGLPLLGISTHVPASNATITYSAKLVNLTSSPYTLYVNRTPADDDIPDRPRTTSSFVLVEFEPAS